ncbi:hypothetical protein [Brevibacillus migulae]|uniref:hypothetical protein n=1 Tax=Brevibacillus migulae TaxID=1644114 RepID=UPI00106ECFA5|nr:hypothetical protein [Brevibacillus migulae]
MDLTKKEKRIVLFLLGIPLFLTAFLMFPHYEEFSAPGEIVEVTELGIQGHVHVTYVYGGTTKNYLEKLLVWGRLAEVDVHFQPVSQEEAIREEEIEEEVGSAIQQWGIANALEVSGYAAEEADAFEAKFEEIEEKAAKYQGSSFGLMVAIGLVEEERNIDFSQAGQYRIAGTGTIEQDGSVGSIAAVRDKVETAERSDIDYFFIPEDKEDYPGEGMSNQEEAEQYVKEHQLRVKLVPVASLDEALAFLETLP